MRARNQRRMLALLLLPAIIAHAQTRPELDVATIMQDTKKWLGSFPNNPYWSEDSKWICFNWNPEAADADSLYKVSAAGGPPIKLTRAERLRTPPAYGDNSRDFRYKVFDRSGDIFLYDKKRDTILQITNTADTESSPHFTLDETGVVFQRGMNLFVFDRASGVIRQVVDFREGKKPEPDPTPKTDAEKYVKTEELNLIEVLKERKAVRDRTRRAREADRPNAPAEIYIEDWSVENPLLSPDEKYVTLILEEKSKARDTRVPNYVTDGGFTEDIEARPKVGAPLDKSQFAFVDLARDTLIIIETDSLPGIFEIPQFTQAPAKADSNANAKSQSKAREVFVYGPYWSEDGNRAFVVARSADHKDRWLATLDLPSGKLACFEHQRDEAWVGGPNINWGGPGNVGWMPDNQRVWFFSEESGFSHLFVCDPTTGEKRALTSGAFEIYAPQMSRDRKHWYFASNKVHPGERQVYRMPIDGGEWEQFTQLPGRHDAVVSPDGKKLAVIHSLMNQPPELYVQNAAANSKAQQLTFSTKEDWRTYPWRAPEVVQFNARDGAKPYARLYRPDSANGAAVIFVHGAGYLQNAHKWWSSYFREYMFHNLLADKGYAVLDIDYRASAGYGRDWRTAIYRHMGGKDLEDQIDGAKWLVENHAIDPKRIGIYGGSYGGFITLMAMFTTPEAFAAGAALRPVTDWAHYNHGYTSSILNIPQADSLAFRRSSPIYFAEGLQGRLLICHGMMDDNVHFQDTVRLAQRLIELGKTDWEVAIYPLEDHGFKEPSSWADEYRRILKLFEETIGN
jgi:dipeptidyl aminopeptidase/acylaminoacyl peptidase